MYRDDTTGDRSGHGIECSGGSWGWGGGGGRGSTSAEFLLRVFKQILLVSLKTPTDLPFEEFLDQPWNGVRIFYVAAAR